MFMCSIYISLDQSSSPVEPGGGLAAPEGTVLALMEVSRA